MLRHTFCHLPGVGPKTEQKLWSRGITTWDAPDLRADWAEKLDDSRAALAAGDPAYFTEWLPVGQHWRIYGDFQDSCAYVDIETTGLDFQDSITTIVMFDGQTIRHYVQGRNLEAFVEDVRPYRVLVTYNGKCFDVPVLKRCLGAELPGAHIDLRHVLRGAGLKGGLKSCERQIGIDRGDASGIDGSLAVFLWNEYQHHGNERALESLLAYNTHDVVNLQTLLIHAFNTKLRKTPFAAHYNLEPRPLPANEFKVDRELIERLRSSIFGMAMT
jgi:uncharacterized protein YprB with RNaseH-like and TPR domain